MLARGFASDNAAGACPEVLAALAAVNFGHVPAYGADPYTLQAIDTFQQHFGETTEVLFVFNGSAANIVSLQTAVLPHSSVLCAESAHVQVDECGALERFSGCKLLPIPTPDGKLRPELLVPRLARMGDVHHSQPRVVTISQTTEYGTLYSVEEVRALSQFCRQHGLFLHMDGARISNAAAALDLPFRTFTLDAGVDVLSFGGTKNGLLFGEAVLVFRPELQAHLPYIRKQSLQLASKMRFLAAQFQAYFEGDLWLRNARHANAMTRRLADGLAAIPRVRLTQTVHANALFAEIPLSVVPDLQAKFPFYVWNDATAEVRWMTAWDTTPEDVDQFLEALRLALP